MFVRPFVLWLESLIKQSKSCLSSVLVQAQVRILGLIVAESKKEPESKNLYPISMSELVLGEEEKR